MSSLFVEVVNPATGKTEAVPREWLGHPVLDPGYEKTHAQKVADGEVEPVEDDEVPTEKSKVEEIDKFAADHDIDLGEASTKAEKVAVIDAAVAAASPPTPEVPAGDPVGQLVYGESEDLPLVPAAREAMLAARAAAQDTDGTESSTKTPATGE